MTDTADKPQDPATVGELTRYAAARGLTFREMTPEEARARNSNATHVLEGLAAGSIRYAFPHWPHPLLASCCRLVVDDIEAFTSTPIKPTNPRQTG